MPLLNSSGNPVAKQSMTIQLDAPCEASVGTPNWGAVISAGIQLVFAIMTGNQVAIAAAIQALINAIVGTP